VVFSRSRSLFTARAFSIRAFCCQNFWWRGRGRGWESFVRPGHPSFTSHSIPPCAIKLFPPAPCTTIYTIAQFLSSFCPPFTHDELLSARTRTSLARAYIILRAAEIHQRRQRAPENFINQHIIQLLWLWPRGRGAFGNLSIQRRVEKKRKKDNLSR